MPEYTDSQNKVYVQVEVTFDSCGQMVPTALTWEDGRRFRIDRLVDVRPGYSAKAGGQGDIYTVRIQNTECRLFFERAAESFTGPVGRWFVARSG